MPLSPNLRLRSARSTSSTSLSSATAAATVDSARLAEAATASPLLRAMRRGAARRLGSCRLGRAGGRRMLFTSAITVDQLETRVMLSHGAGGDHHDDGHDHDGHGHDDHDDHEHDDHHNEFGELHTLPAVDLNDPNVQQELADYQNSLGQQAGPLPGSYPLGDTFNLSSNPSATKTIYLDFDGHTTIDPWWNSGNPINTPAYDIDNNPGAFSNAELSNIQDIYDYVVEDFAPFDVNVTTAEPPLSDLINSGGTDDRWGIRVVIGGDGSWYAPAGGVAYLNSFNANVDRPTFVFTDNLGNGFPRYVAAATSHEVGHTLGLSHDGETGGDGEYFDGHGPGPSGFTHDWGPIMGSGYYAQVTQWSKGEYANATQLQDDLQMITTLNGFGYKADDYAGNIATAADIPATPAAGGSGRTVSLEGLISETTDADVFRIEVEAGTITLAADGAQFGQNLDIGLRLLDANGQVVAAADPQNSLDATITANVAQGVYYLEIDGVGKAAVAGNPGYSDYGSLGEYTITGSIPDVPSTGGANDPVLVTDANVDYTIGGAAVAALGNVTVSDSDSPDFDGGNVELLLEFTGQLEQIELDPNSATVQVVGGSVEVGGVVIGTANASSNVNYNGTVYQRVDYSLNASATAARVEQLLAAHQFRSLEASPATGSRQVVVELNDGDGGRGQATSTITVVSSNADPVVALGGQTGVFVGGAYAPVFDSPVISDADSADFDGGSIRLMVESPLSGGFSLSFDWNSPRITRSAGSIKVDGITVGTNAQLSTETNSLGRFSVNSYDLVAGATPELVQELVEHYTMAAFAVSGTAPQTRITRVELTDGDGGFAAADSSIQLLNASDDPVLAASPVVHDLALGDTAPLVNGFTVTDADSPNFDGGTLRMMHENNGYGDQVQIDPDSNVTFLNGEILVAGTAIGTLDGVATVTRSGVDYTSIDFTLNANATAATVEAFIAGQVLVAGPNSPGPDLRLTRFELTDGAGGSGSVDSSVDFTVAPSGDPVLTADAVVTQDIAVSPAADLVANFSITDADSPDFDGGTLRLMGETGLGDFFEIDPTSGAVFSGGTIAVDGITIGSYVSFGVEGRGGVDYDTVTFALNADATAARVEQFVSAHRRVTTPNAPVEGLRQVRIELEDGAGGAGAVDAAIDFVTAPSGDPVLTADAVVTQNLSVGNRADIVANFTVTDADSPNFDGGVVRLMAEASFADTIDIDPNSGVTFANNNIIVDGVAIGSYVSYGVETRGGVDYNTATFSLNADATAARVEQFVMGNDLIINPNTLLEGLRQVRIELEDGAGGAGAVDAGVEFDSQPSADPEISADTVWHDLTLGNAAPLSKNFTVTDADSPNFNGGRLSLLHEQTGYGDTIQIDPNSNVTSVNGDILVDGVVIGSYDSTETRNLFGQDYIAINFSLNANATPTRVEQFVAGQQLVAGPNSPGPEIRLTRFEVADGAGGFDGYNSFVNFMPGPTDPPVLTADPVHRYDINNGPYGPVFNNISVTDIDSPNFDFGILEIGAERSSGGFIDTDTPVVDGVQIGRYIQSTYQTHNGVEYLTATYRLNTEATPERVEQFLASRVMVINLPALEERSWEIRLSVEDGDGAETELYTRLEYNNPSNDPMLAAAPSVAYAPGSDFISWHSGFSITDDSTQYFGGTLSLLHQTDVPGDVVEVRTDPASGFTVNANGLYAELNGDPFGNWLGLPAATGTVTVDGVEYFKRSWTLRDNANPANIEAFVAAQQWRLTNANPAAGPRQLIVELTDEGGNFGSLTTEINVTNTPVDPVPVLTADPVITLDTATSLQLNGYPYGPLLGNFQLSDADSANFDGGTLRLMNVDPTGGQNGQYEAIFANPGLGTSYSGGNILVDGVAIGTYDGFTVENINGTVFTSRNFSLNADATQARTAKWIRTSHLYIQSFDPIYGLRDVRVELTDGDGNTGSVETQVLVVVPNDPPTLTADAGVTRYVPGASVELVSNFSIADTDNLDFNRGTLRIMREDRGLDESIEFDSIRDVYTYVDPQTQEERVVVDNLFIGTIRAETTETRGGVDYVSWNIDLNYAAANGERVTEFINSLVFETREPIVPLGTVRTRIELDDGRGGTGAVDSQVAFVTDTLTPPVIVSDASQTFVMGQDPIALQSNLLLNDTDSDHFAGGSLRVYLEEVTGVSSYFDETLGGDGRTQVFFNDGESRVLVDGINVAETVRTIVPGRTTINGVSYHYQDWIFSGSATRDRVETLMRNIAFDVTFPLSQPQVVNVGFQLTEAGGPATSNFTTIDVQKSLDPTIAADPSVTWTEAGGVPVDLFSNLAFSDLDTTDWSRAEIEVLVEIVDGGEVLTLDPSSNVTQDPGTVWIEIDGTREARMRLETPTTVTVGGVDYLRYEIDALNLGFQLAGDVAAETILSALQFNTTAPDPVGGLRDIQVNVDDGWLGTATLSTTVDVVALPSDDPVLTADADVTYDVTGGQVPLVTGLTITDGDSASFGGGVLRVMVEDTPQNEGFTVDESGSVAINGQDVLVDGVLIGTTAGNTTETRGGVSYTTANFSLNAAATPAAVTTLVGAFRFENYEADPQLGARAVRIELEDGAGGAGAVDATITLFTSNTGQPPVITSDPDTVFTEGDAESELTTNLSITDADSPSLAGGTLRILLEDVSLADTVFLSDTTVAFVDPGTGLLFVNGQYAGSALGSGVDTVDGVSYSTISYLLDGSATPAMVEALVNAHAFANTDTNPSAGPRDLRIEVTDGDGNLGVGLSTITVQAYDDPATFAYAGQGSVLQLTEQDPPAAVLGQVNVTDPDSLEFAGAIVDFGWKFAADEQAGDAFSLNAAGYSIQGSDLLAGSVVVGSVTVDGHRTRLTLSGDASQSPALTETMLEEIMGGIEFQSTTDDPAPSRLASVLVIIGSVSTLLQREIAITPVDDASDLTLPTTTVQFVEDAGPVAFGAGAVLTDPDTPVYDGAQILARTVSGRQVGERYTVGDVGGVSVSGASVSYNGDVVGTITSGGSLLIVELSALATPAAAEAVINAIQYESISEDPAPAKVGQVWLTDPTGKRHIVNRDIAAQSVNDIPGVANIRGSLTFFEDGGPRLLSGQAHVADPDWSGGGSVSLSWSDFGAADEIILLDLGVITSSGDLAELTTGDELFYNGSKIADVTVQDDGATGTITFDLVPVTNRFEVREIFRAAAFDNTSQGPETQVRTVTFGFTDEVGATGSQSMIVRMQAYNDAAEVTVQTASLQTFNPNAYEIVGSATTVSDPDGPSFAGGRLIVQFAGGQRSGDRLRLLSDGAFSVPQSTGAAVVSGGVTVGQLVQQGQQVRINFNADATTAAVNEVLTRVLYENIADPFTQGLQLGQRTLRVTAFDAANEGSFGEFTLDVLQSPSDSPALDAAAASLLGDDWL